MLRAKSRIDGTGLIRLGGTGTATSAAWEPPSFNTAWIMLLDRFLQCAAAHSYPPRSLARTRTRLVQEVCQRRPDRAQRRLVPLTTTARRLLDQA